MTQGTFAIAVEKIHQFRGECKVSTWLCQIAKHLWYKELKKTQKNKSISMDELSEDFATQPTTEEVILQNEEKLKLFKSMQKLDDRRSGRYKINNMSVVIMHLNIIITSQI